MTDPTHQDQAHADQAGAQAQRCATDSQSQRASDEAHGDAQEAVAATRAGNAILKAGNPFSFTNVVLVLGLALFTWMASNIWGTLQDGQKQAAAVQQANHDELLVDGLILTNMQYDIGSMKRDIATLRANCMDERRVDERIHALVPTARYSSGARRNTDEENLP